MDAKQWADDLENAATGTTDEPEGHVCLHGDAARDVAALLRAEAQAVDEAANWRAVAGEGAIQHAATRERLERAVGLLRKAPLRDGYSTWRLMCDALLAEHDEDGPLPVEEANAPLATVCPVPPFPKVRP